jgi:hypothetical protein
LVLQAQGQFMNKDSTHGNAFWTPEYQQQMEQLKKQQLEQQELEGIEEISDNARYYNPDA